MRMRMTAGLPMRMTRLDGSIYMTAHRDGTCARVGALGLEKAGLIHPLAVPDLKRRFEYRSDRPSYRRVLGTSPTTRRALQNYSKITPKLLQNYSKITPKLLQNE